MYSPYWRHLREIADRVRHSSAMKQNLHCLPAFSLFTQLLANPYIQTAILCAHTQAVLLGCPSQVSCSTLMSCWLPSCTKTSREWSSAVPVLYYLWKNLLTVHMPQSRSRFSKWIVGRDDVILMSGMKQESQKHQKLTQETRTHETLASFQAPVLGWTV